MTTPLRLFDEYLTPAPPPAVDAPAVAPSTAPSLDRTLDRTLEPTLASVPANAPSPAPVGAPPVLPPAPPRSSTPDAPVQRSSLTGFDVRYPFLAFWTNFGVGLCGEPLTDEVIVDGRRAQVFERLILAEVAPGRVSPLDIGAQWLHAAAERAAGQPKRAGDVLVIADRTAEFGAEGYPRRTLSDIRYIVVHHTGAAPGVGPEEIAREHRDALGWPGIGYHFVVDADGGVHQTQDVTAVSHHARQFNGVAIGVALCGNFDDAPPPPGQLDRAAALVAHLVDRLGLPLDAVRGHGELVPTPCPGQTYLGGWQPTLLEMVARYAGRDVRHAEVRAIVPSEIAATALVPATVEPMNVEPTTIESPVLEPTATEPNVTPL